MSLFDITCSFILLTFKNSFLFLCIFITKYNAAISPPKNAPDTATATPVLILLPRTLIVIYDPINITAILITCSNTWLYEVGAINLWPCKYPFNTERYGIINKQNDIVLITNTTSFIEFPPSISPMII